MSIVLKSYHIEYSYLMLGDTYTNRTFIKGISLENAWESFVNENKNFHNTSFKITKILHEEVLPIQG